MWLCTVGSSVCVSLVAYAFVRAVKQEIQTMIIANHLSQDIRCWVENPECIRLLSEHEFTEFIQVAVPCPCKNSIALLNAF